MTSGALTAVTPIGAAEEGGAPPPTPALWPGRSARSVMGAGEHRAGEFEAAPDLAVQGLYDPALQKDSCGVGFIADITGKRTHQLVKYARAILYNLKHGGA